MKHAPSFLQGICLIILTYALFVLWRQVAPTVAVPGDVQRQLIYIRIDEGLIDDLRIPPAQWVFSGLSWDQTFAILRRSGVKNPESYQSFAQSTDFGTVVTPPTHILKEIDPQTRANLYRWLGEDPSNPQAVYPFCYYTARLDERFRNVSPETRARITKYFYPAGPERVYLSDVGNLCEELPQDERIKAIQAISEQQTLLLSVWVTPKTDIKALAERWNIGSVSKDFLSLLKSIQASGKPTQLDLLNLLPRFIKGHVYTYPPKNDTGVPKDCFWTSLNVHSAITDYELQGEKIGHVLKENFRVMPNGTLPQYGDLLIYFNERGKSIHVAVYITDDILFTKNGATILSPWIFQTKAAMEEIYPQIDNTRVEIYRHIKPI